MECVSRCFAKWRLWIGPLAVLIYALVVLVYIPVFLLRSIREGFSSRDQEILISGIFSWLAIPISVWEIVQHLVHYSQPRLQKHIIRILWMVPIYAINAWMVLIYPKQSIYMDSIRECYEAYVIYNFMTFLLNYLNAAMDLEVSLELRPQVKHIFPLCCLPDWQMGREFVHMCKHGILQYTVMRPLTTAISCICWYYGVYGDGEFNASVAFPYLLTVNNFSQFMAMYCLVLFYKATAAELRPMKPLPKFLCIKAVVFFSFFQGTLIDFLVYSGILLPNTSSVEHLNISKRLQNFIICIEMCMAAVAHHYSFSWKQFADPHSQHNLYQAFLAMWDISDVQRDIQEHLGVVGSSLSRRIRGKSMYHLARGEDESDRLLTRPSSSAPSTVLYQGEDVLTYGAAGNTSLNSTMERL